jgi:hypothetical protein
VTSSIFEPSSRISQLDLTPAARGHHVSRQTTTRSPTLRIGAVAAACLFFPAAMIGQASPASRDTGDSAAFRDAIARSRAFTRDPW